jgi:hypothetical protein
MASKRWQKGLMAMALVVALGLATTAWLVHHALHPNTRTLREQKTAAALATAKAALIGWAVSNASKPGTLPCTDTSNNGSASTSGTNCSAYVGRLPWKQLGTGDLRDGDNECLWYALSPVFRNAMNVSGSNSRVNFPLNSNTQGTITLKDKNGNVLASKLVAVILAAGSPQAGQTRAGVGTTCGGNTLASNYLENLNSINNATGNYDAATGALTFVVSEPSASFNDRLSAITPEDLYRPLRKRIALELMGTSNPTYGLLWYYNKNHVYPWAANASYTQQAGTTSQYLPYGDLNFSVSALNAWLVNNQWLPLVTYSLGSDFQPGTTYPQQCATGCLMARGEQAQASVQVGGGNGTWTTRVCATNALVKHCPLP